MLSAAGWCEGFSRGIDLRASLWENRLSEDPQLMELLGPVMALAVDEGILSADTEFEKLSEDEYDECLSQVPAVLGAVNQYWQAKPVSEAEVEAMVHQQKPGDDDDDNSPPRQRSGHWVH